MSWQSLIICMPLLAGLGRTKKMTCGQMHSSIDDRNHLELSHLDQKSNLFIYLTWLMTSGTAHGGGGSRIP